jgi:NADPH:quinone reductase-like Zn-dependent oxidoreductase
LRSCSLSGASAGLPPDLSPSPLNACAIAAASRGRGRCHGTAASQTLRDLGADLALDHRADDVFCGGAAENGGAGVDAVLDAVAGDTIARSASVTRPFGRLATILGAQGS